MKIIEKTFETNGSMDYRQKTDKIILHHADASKCTVEDIDRWHKDKGWCKIGYHFFVDKQGNIYRGREENAVGAHAYGSNYDSIGICVEGKYMEETMPEAQKNAVVELIKYLENKYNIKTIQVHKDINATSCPGSNFPVDEIIKLAHEEETEGKIANVQKTLNERYKLNIAVDNIYGNETKTAMIKGLQTELNKQFGANLKVDGIFGELTKKSCINVQKGAQGNITYLIQAMLLCKGFYIEIDSIFGDDTKDVVKDFQIKNNLNVDGIVGPNTFEKLFKVQESRGSRGTELFGTTQKLIKM